MWQTEATVDLRQGQAESDEPTEYPAAVLWVPDPEQRHGWREFYVKKARPKPGNGRMGYRK